MNQALLNARKQFQGQTAKLKSSQGEFDNSPFTVGLHVLEITASELREKKDRPSHYVQMKIIGGPDDGRIAFLYSACYLDEADGVVRSASDVRRILGEDSVDGMETDDGFEIDLAAYLENFDEVAAALIGETIEAKCVNGKTNKDDGTPWQNWYVQRGLGDDAPAAKKTAAEAKPPERRTVASSMAVGKKKKAVVKKRKVIKRKR